ncbi:MAG: Rpn family recombination-promoting nuclease/putative transposase [Pseudomonadota bacterium]
MTFTNKLLDPKNDVAFKRIFGTEKNKDILIHFLNDMLVFKENKPIEDVTFLKPILDPEIFAKKTSIVDVLCKDTDGNTYIVEMQVAKTKGFEKRAQFYASKAYSGQANVGDEYQNLKEVVFLAIADYVMFPEKKALKSDHVILDRDTFEHDLTDFSFTFLELGKFKKAKEDINALTNITEKWCYFFKYAEEVTAEELAVLIGEDTVIEKAYKELNQFYWTEGELLGYEAALKKERDYKAGMDQKFYDGLAEGKREVALEMLRDNEPDAKILKYAKLTSDELTMLKQSLK